MIALQKRSDHASANRKFRIFDAASIRLSLLLLISVGLVALILLPSVLDRRMPIEYIGGLNWVTEAQKKRQEKRM
jgi:hypothetical protein